MPIELSQSFILESAKWFFDKKLEIYDLVALPGGAVAKKLLRELEKGESSKTEVIRLAFEYLRVLAREEKIVVFMDEFQEILKLKNYMELRNILGIFREYINDEKILFVISGSFPHIMRDMIANGGHPFYIVSIAKRTKLIHKILERRYLKAKTELRKAKESEIREKLKFAKSNGIKVLDKNLKEVREK